MSAGDVSLPCTPWKISRENKVPAEGDLDVQLFYMVTDSKCRQALSDGQGYSLRPSVLEGVGLSSHKWQNEDAD